MNNRPAKTPLVDLLKSMPEDSRMTWEYIGESRGGVVPIGRMCHEAASRLAAQEVQLSAMREGQRVHEKVIKDLIAERDARDADIARLKAIVKATLEWYEAHEQMDVELSSDETEAGEEFEKTIQRYNNAVATLREIMAGAK